MYLIKWPVRQKRTEALTSAGTVKCVAWVMLVKEKEKSQSICSSASLNVSFLPAGFLCCTFVLHSWHWSIRCLPAPRSELSGVSNHPSSFLWFKVLTIRTDHITLPPASTYAQVLFPHNRCWSAPISMFVCTVKKKVFWTPTFLLNPN